MVSSCDNRRVVGGKGGWIGCVYQACAAAAPDEGCDVALRALDRGAAGVGESE